MYCHKSFESNDKYLQAFAVSNGKSAQSKKNMMTPPYRVYPANDEQATNPIVTENDEKITITLGQCFKRMNAMQCNTIHQDSDEPTNMMIQHLQKLILNR
jgi:hypothetical protein